ncbi:tetratricopeptide repeat protein [Campylobacter geochelonis]|uniref:beta-lactamase n=1 Tax=Campylobacter geochelonis TaxID=1780362 RepID=A0A128EHM3_9BACT|nr:sel1 repeat family protein [Campylobacter geochelonis]QKF71418.1 Sel1 domain-containing protein [Campylobacter geochelonis]CZE48380.1 Sel1 repeat-containing protein [Campylobacter geochelonis]
MKKVVFLTFLGLNFAFAGANFDALLEACITKSDSTSCAQILNYLDDECKKGVQSKCFLYADMLGRGVGVEKDVVKSFEVYKQSCEANSSESCYELSKKYLDASGTVQSFSLSGIALDKACKLGSKRACDILALLPNN